MRTSESEDAGKGGPSTKAVEIFVAALFLFIGALVIYDSIRVGIGWAFDGPRAGYFPFYIGVIICIASGSVLVQTLFARNPDLKPFIGAGKLKPVLFVLLPSAVYVIAIYFIGIYVASALFIGAFMRRQGKFGWTKVLLISVSVPIVMFFMFEVWFLVPLPKGPAEALLGY